MKKTITKAVALAIILASLPMSAMDPQGADQAAQGAPQAQASNDQRPSSFMGWWSRRNTIEKSAIACTALIGGALAGLFGIYKFAPKAFKVGKTVLKTITTIGAPIITYLTIKSYVKPKPEEKSWGEEIKDDFFGACRWIGSLFGYQTSKK